MKKIIACIVIAFLAAVLAFLFLHASSSSKDYRAKYEGVDLSADIGKISRANTYGNYLVNYSGKHDGLKDIQIDLFDYATGQSNGVRVVNDVGGESKALYTDDGSEVTWKVNVEAEGFYYISLDYISVPSRGVDMERSVYINGNLPFSGADDLLFNRLWADGEKISSDNQGNAIRPSQSEVYKWQESFCKDSLGYEIFPYRFYFRAGENTLSLKAKNEPMVLRGVSLRAISKLKSYSEYTVDSRGKGGNGEGTVIKVQGEDSTVRSAPSLFAKYDRSSPVTEPYSVSHTVLNYIGGDAWNKAGQWIEWEYTVPADGLYSISIKARQQYQRGSISCRSLYIDGEIPFDEMKSVGFSYGVDWRTLTLSDVDGKPFSFYLKAGKHTIRLEATLGKMGTLINELEDSIFRLNQIYRTLLVLTGPTPDQFRDFNIDKVYPEEISAMSLESKRLYRIVDEVVAYTGQKSDKIAAAQTMAIQLEKFVKNPDKITKMFTNFKDNITALGSSLQSLSESKLDIDTLVFSSPDEKIPDVKPSIIQRLRHEVLSFIASFIGNYGSLGNVYDAKQNHVIQVWLVTGRDQSTILKNMIDDTFTPESGIKVNVKLVDPSALLSAVIAGNGPDVVLSVGSSLPVDYSLRHAVVDLTQFPDFNEVAGQFYESAYTSFKYDGGIYALPETETFSVLFYRKDILSQLGLAIPDTWDDLISMLSTLQSNNLSAGIPYTSIQMPNLSVFYSMVYQNEGTVYNDAGTRTALDSEAGVAAFKTYTNFFTSYGLPKDYDFVSRFRSGEMPIGIADYSTYNTLVVSAPEIRGLWDFTLMPGVKRANKAGEMYIDRSNNAGGVCCMMIQTDNAQIKKDSWEFMKWWVTADTQVRFGREIESLLGASARYATANVKALGQLSWSSSQLKVLESSLDSTVGFREVPGGYYTSRHITNAVRKIINEREDPRETLIDYARTINEELAKKQLEFGITENGGRKK